MKHNNRLVVASVLAGSLALATLGVVRAQTASDTVVSTAEVTANATATAVTPKMHIRGPMMDDKAKELGITADQLKTELESGKPMYQIEAEHGLTFAKQKATRLAELKTRLDDMVKVGYMTQAEADAAYTEAESSSMIGMGGPGFHGRPMK